MRRAAVMEVSLDEPLRELEVEDRYDRVLLVPTFRGEVLGEALIPAARALTVEAQRSAFRGKVAELLLRRRLTLAFQAAAGVQPRDGGADARSLTVSVVVCARAGSEANLAATLESLRGLRRAPDEIIVAGPVSIGPDTRHVIERSGNLARAANRGIAAARGEVIAMTRDGCAVNPRWLDSVDASLSDPLVMAAVGYAGPEAIETRADWAAHRQAARRRRRGRIDTRNALFRRAAFEELGLLDEGGAPGVEISRRIAGAGFRLLRAPNGVVWDRAPGRPSRAAPRLRRRIRTLEPVVRSEDAPSAVRSEHPPVTVAIASYNRRDELAATVEALRAQSYPLDRFEVVVVLDGSTDGSAERLRAIDVPYRLRVMEQENRGLGASRNRGAREAEHPMVVFLDDDAVPEPEFVAAHVAAQRELPRDGFVLGYTPPVIRAEGFWSIAVRNWWEDFFRRRQEPGHLWTFMDVADGNSSILRSLFLELDGFDEKMERRHDWEFGVRLLKRGVPLAHRHDAVAWHHFDTSFAAAVRNRRHEGRADIPFTMRHPETKGRLLIANLAGLDGAGLSARRLLAYRNPDASAALARAAIPALRLLEILGLHRAWTRLSNMLLTNSYLQGLTDAMPSIEDFREFMAPALRGEGGRVVNLHLDSGEPGALPSTETGWLSLVLHLAGVPLARVVAPEPGRQWDWMALTERAVAECAPAVGADGLDAVESLATSHPSDPDVRMPA